MVDYQLISIVKSIFNKDYNKIDIADWKSLAISARSSGLLPCLAYYYQSLPDEKKPSEEITAFFKKNLIKSTVVGTNQLSSVYEMQQIFEKNKIYNLVVKGAKTKTRYPDEVLRSMGDVDVLYKPEQHKEFYNLMMNSLGYEDFQEGRKNDTYTKNKIIVVEAHRQLVSTESEYIDYLNTVWERAIPCQNCEYTYEMTIEDEFIYNIIHLVEHFKQGGVGIRFIMDIWVYNNLDMNREYLKQELENLGLFDFYVTMSQLADYWFGNGESTELLEKLGEFICSSGIFGNRENVSAMAIEDGSKIKTIIKVCFPSYKDMTTMFLWLKKYPFLLPIAWLIRAFRSLTKRKNNVKVQLSVIKDGDNNKGNELREFYKECGLG